MKLHNKIGLAAGPLIAAGGIAAVILASGGSAMASSPATVCSSPTSCVTGDPVLASVDIQSATAATLSGSSMTFGSSTGVLPGNTVTGQETYSVGTNDAAGAYVTATWDDSEVTASQVTSLVSEPGNTGQTTTGFAQDEQLSTSGPDYNQGMVNLSTLRCSGNSNLCAQDTDIPWSQISVTPAAGAGGTPATFAYSSTGGVNPANVPNFGGNNEGAAGQGGGSTVATVASFTGPVTTESLTDTYSLNVPSSQEAGIYAADLWYQVISN